MQTTLALAIAMALAGSPVWAEKLANGLEFITPAGWTVRSNQEAAILLPPDMAMEPNGKDPAELYVVAILPGVKDLQDPQLVSALRSQQLLGNAEVRSAGASQAFRATGGPGYLHRYDAMSEGVALRLHVYAVGLQGSGVAALLAMGRPALVARREPAVSTVAASFFRQSGAAVQNSAVAQNSPATSNSPAAAQWDQRLRGRKLYKFSGYSSSYGSGGYNSQSTLLLAANGNYEFRRSSSVSVYVDGASGGSSSQNGGQGRWRIVEQGGKAVLELVSNSGTENIALTADGSKTLLNGQRWLVGDK